MYNPKIWYTGDIVSSGGLNNMEQGIAQNAHDIETINDSIEDLSTDTTELKSDLNDKYNYITEGTENINTAFCGRYSVSSSGVINASSNNYIGLSEPIKCKADVLYTIKLVDSGIVSGGASFFVVCYNSNGEMVGSRSEINVATSDLYVRYTTHNNAEYMMVAIWSGNGISANAKIMITEGTKLYSGFIPPFRPIQDPIIQNISSETRNINTVNVGRYSVNSSGGIDSASDNYIGVENLIKCEPSTTYTIAYYDTGIVSGGASLFYAFYDSNKAMVGSRTEVGKSSEVVIYQQVTTPSDACYIVTAMWSGNGIASDAKIQITKGTEKYDEYIQPYTVEDIELREYLGYEIPSYFESQLSDKIPVIISNYMEIGNNGDSFVFITDSHWGINKKNSPKLIKKIIENTTLQNVIFGGDALDSGTKEDEIEKGKDFMNAFNFLRNGLMFNYGNHDSNRAGNTDSARHLTVEEVFGLFFTQAKMDMENVHCNSGANDPIIYYSFDVPASNTRYLVIGAGEGVIPSSEIDWIYTQLDSNPTKNCVVIAHYLYDESNGTYTTDANTLFQRIQSKANLKAVLYGHMHNDKVDYIGNGIPVIATDTDATSRLSSQNPNTVTLGTVTEQAFDAVTINHSNKNVKCVRIGRGKDRYIHGGSVSVSVGGTVTLSTSLTGVTWSISNSGKATVSNGVVTGVSNGNAIIKAVNSSNEEYWLITIA